MAVAKEYVASHAMNQNKPLSSTKERLGNAYRQNATLPQIVQMATTLIGTLYSFTFVENTSSKSPINKANKEADLAKYGTRSPSGSLGSIFNTHHDSQECGITTPTIAMHPRTPANRSIHVSTVSAEGMTKLARSPYPWPVGHPRDSSLALRQVLHEGSKVIPHE